MTRAVAMTTIIGFCCIVAACGPAPTPGNSLNLPEGDVDAGQQAFVDLQCTSCHTVKNLELPDPDVQGPVSIMFGGRLTRVKSYSDLITSIVNPSHRLVRGYSADRVSEDGESRMPTLNDVMTVTQLIDITAFLQAQYDVKPIARYQYPSYKYGSEEEETQAE